MDKVLLLNLILCSTLTACGGGGSTSDSPAPSVVFEKELADDGSTTLTGRESLTLTFSEAIQTDSLVLSGDMLPNCNDPADETSCLNLDWSEGSTVLTLTPKENFYWYADKRSLDVTVAGYGTLQLKETVSATVLPVFETFQAADVVIGQSTFETRGEGSGGNNLSFPNGVSVYQIDGRVGVLIADSSNYRVLKFRTVPTDNGVHYNESLGENFDVNGGLVGSGRATSLIGQEDFGNVISSQCSQNSLSWPVALEVIENESGLKWILADNYNSRLMIWNNPDDSKSDGASQVLGQENFDDCSANGPVSAGLKSVLFPLGVWSNGEKLVVSSNNNHRILVWNSFPTKSNQSPDFQLGQNTDIGSAANSGNVTASQRSMYIPAGIGGNKYQMCVADMYNHRVLVWNELPDSSKDLADIVIGQSDFSKNTKNDIDQNGKTSLQINSRVLNTPHGCDISMEQLFIADKNNNRVLIFNALNKRPINN